MGLMDTESILLIRFANPRVKIGSNTSKKKSLRTLNEENKFFKVKRWSLTSQKL